MRRLAFVVSAVASLACLGGPTTPPCVVPEHAAEINTRLKGTEPYATTCDACTAQYPEPHASSAGALSAYAAWPCRDVCGFERAWGDALACCPGGSLERVAAPQDEAVRDSVTDDHGVVRGGVAVCAAY